MKTIVLGITGASGSAYAVRLAEQLLERGCTLHLVCTGNGRLVLQHETGIILEQWAADLNARHSSVTLEDNDNLFSLVASGSYPADATVIAPCSMATLGRIANGTGGDLLCRAADVAIKEGRKLLLVPRETPLSAIHLENMLKLARLGVGILPAMPGFYGHPRSIADTVDFVAGKALDWLGIRNELYHRWGETK